MTTRPLLNVLFVFVTLLLTINQNPIMAQNAMDGKATSTKKGLHMETTVSISINATPATIWALLTNADDLPRWNSTVKSIEGKIADGEKIKLVAESSPDRTFSLKISQFIPEKEMVWRDGFAPMFKGVRTYTLTPSKDGSTQFTMTEVFSGLMLPMIAKSLPDFVPVFEQYARDLKHEAEKLPQ